MRNFLTRNLHLNSRSYLKFIWLFFLAISPLASWGQSVYYVAPDGDDSGSGSFNDPWATWEEAFNNSKVEPGDTVYFRGGVYYYTDTDGGYGYRCSRDGSNGNYIHYFNYPGEEPILDCKNIVSTNTTLVYPLYTKDINYIHFKGLTVRNVWQTDGTDECKAWQFGGDHIIVENCNVYNIHGGGFKTDNCDNTYFINCDAWNCCDSLTTVPVSNPVPGNDGTGFLDGNRSNTKSTVYYINCRAWNCGDQGFSTGSIGKTVYKGCWSFKNGQLEGGGHGFKMGWVSTIDEDVVNRVYNNCIAAYNMYYGFTSNDQGYECGAFEVYNNIAYHNGYVPNDTKQSKGFCIYNTNDSDARELRRVYRNNISYDNETGETFIKSTALYTGSNNSWDTDVTVTDADFISVDSTGLSSPRNSDGSLPDLNGFLELANGSDLIDAGVDVGLDYYGSNPDLGYYEYQPEDTSDDITIQIKIVKTFPNPTRDLLAIQFYCQEAGTIPLTVTDETGTIVLTQNISASEDINKIVLDFSTFDNGTYKVTLNYNDAEVSTIIYKNDLL